MNLPANARYNGQGAIIFAPSRPYNPKTAIKQLQTKVESLESSLAEKSKIIEDLILRIEKLENSQSQQSNQTQAIPSNLRAVPIPQE